MDMRIIRDNSFRRLGTSGEIDLLARINIGGGLFAQYYIVNYLASIYKSLL